MDIWLAILKQCDFRDLIFFKNTCKSNLEFVDKHFLFLVSKYLENTKIIPGFKPLIYQLAFSIKPGSMIWDVEMGLGKTVMGLLRLGKSTNNLIVCPPSIINVWVKEVTSYFPTMTYQVCNTNKITENKDVHFITYGKLINYNKITDHKWNITILDECHKITNDKTVTHIAAMRIKSKTKIAMSGTIIRNKPNELKNVIKFIGVPESRYMKHYKCLKIDDTKIELPQLNEITHFLHLGQEHQLIYNAIKDKFADEYNSFKEKLTQLGKVNAAFLRLRQICLSPRLLFEDGDLPHIKINSSPKVAKLEEILKTYSGKFVVMSKFSSMLTKINEYLPGLLLIGPTKKKKEIIDLFKSSDCKVLYAQSDVASEGIDLTCANNLVLLEPWWNFESDKQSISRIWRIGQTKMCRVFRLIIKNSVEEVMLDLCKDKKMMSDNIKSGMYQLFL